MSEEVKFLTMAELCIKLRISDDAARRMLKDGKLVGMKLATGEWRVVDPGPKFEAYLRGVEEHLLHVPLLTVDEVVAVTGYNYFHVHRLVGQGKLKPEGRTKRTALLFTVAEVRRFLWEKKKLKRPQRYTVKLEQVVRWAIQILAPYREATAAVVKDEMHETAVQILKLPEPVRSQSLAELFQKLDLAQWMVLEASKLESHTPETDRSQTPGLPEIIQ